MPTGVGVAYSSREAPIFRWGRNVTDLNPEKALTRKPLKNPRTQKNFPTTLRGPLYKAQNGHPLENHVLKPFPCFWLRRP